MSETALLGPGGGITERGFLHHALLFRAANLTEARSVGPSLFEGVPQKPGGRKWVPTRDGEWHVTVEYEGFVGDDDDPEAPENFEILHTKSTEPIESHPDIAELIDTYGGQEDGETHKITWPLFYDARAAAPATGLGSPLTLDTYRPQFGPNKDPNPMAGRETYWRFGKIVRWTFGSRSFPHAWESRHGTVLKAIPGPVKKRAGYDWLVVIQNIRARGSGDALGYETTIDFIQSEKGGWPPTQTVIQNA